MLKLFAGRALDGRDAEGIAVRQAQRLDGAYIASRLGPLAELKEEAAPLSELARIRKLAQSIG